MTTENQITEAQRAQFREWWDANKGNDEWLEILRRKRNYGDFLVYVQTAFCAGVRSGQKATGSMDKLRSDAAYNKDGL